jgi:hypothetical protein
LRLLSKRYVRSFVRDSPKDEFGFDLPLFFFPPVINPRGDWARSANPDPSADGFIEQDHYEQHD